MKVLFKPDQFLINATNELEEENQVESNIFLRALRIINDSENSIELIKIDFELRINDFIERIITYPKKVLQNRFQQVAELLPKYKKNSWGTSIKLGQYSFWDENAFTKHIIYPENETGLIDEHFVIRTNKPINILRIIVYFIENGEERSTNIEIPVKEYKVKNEYIFPLKGKWLIANNWDNPYGHRTEHSQEFAFDIIQIDSNQQFLLDKPYPNSSYPFYGSEILAIADGEVIELNNTYLENPSSLEMISKEERKEHLDQMGLMPVLAGNYVILKHDNEECSLYAHMIPGSIPVKVGVNVKQGQVIGALGNSGNSDGPHLHFQLMQGSDFLKARGLPCEFINIQDFTGNDLKSISQDLLLIQTKSVKGEI